MKKLLFFIFLPLWAFSQEVTIYQKSNFAIKETGKDAVIAIISDAVIQGVTVNYTIDRASGNGNIQIQEGETGSLVSVSSFPYSGSVDFLAGNQMQKLQVFYQTGTGNDKYTVTLNTGTGYTVGSQSSAQFDAVEFEPRKAFPTAFGAGAYTSIGNNYSVLHVTSTSNGNTGTYDPVNKTGEGTLDWAIQQTFPKVIVFDVSGTITYPDGFYFKSDLSDSTYLAGQTAPRGGITIESNWYEPDFDNAIVRYLRFVHIGISNAGGAINGQAVITQGQNLIYDHISSRYSFNSTAAGVCCDDITYQNALMGESKTAMIVGTNSGSIERVEEAGNASLLNSLWVHISHRFPNTTGNLNLDVINNVAYNYKFRHNVIPNDIKMNMIGNAYQPGPTTTGFNLSNSATQFIADHVDNTRYQTPQVYYEGNLSNDPYRPYTKDQDAWDITWRFWSDGSVIPSQVTYRANTQHDFKFPLPTILDADVALANIANDVGANKYLNDDGTYGIYYDEVDQSYIDDFTNGTCLRCDPLSFNDYVNKGDPSALVYPTLPSNTRPVDFDTDRDGMPNVWETANSLDPNVNDSTGYDLDSEYTNLEVYLNLVDTATTNGPVTGLMWDNDTQTVSVGGSLDLSYTFAPINPDDSGFTLLSSDTGVINNTGAVIGAGVATLTITADDTTNGTISDVMNVTVNPTLPGIKINSGRARLNGGRLRIKTN